MKFAGKPALVARILGSQNVDRGVLSRLLQGPRKEVLQGLRGYGSQLGVVGTRARPGSAPLQVDPHSAGYLAQGRGPSNFAQAVRRFENIELPPKLSPNFAPGSPSDWPPVPSPPATKPPVGRVLPPEEIKALSAAKPPAPFPIKPVLGAAGAAGTLAAGVGAAQLASKGTEAVQQTLTAGDAAIKQLSTPPTPPPTVDPATMPDWVKYLPHAGLGVAGTLGLYSLYKQRQQRAEEERARTQQVNLLPKTASAAQQWVADHEFVAGFLVACHKAGLSDEQIHEKIAEACRQDLEIAEEFYAAFGKTAGILDGVAPSAAVQSIHTPPKPLQGPLAAGPKPPLSPAPSGLLSPNLSTATTTATGMSPPQLPMPRLSAAPAPTPAPATQTPQPNGSPSWVSRYGAELRRNFIPWSAEWKNTGENYPDAGLRLTSQIAGGVGAAAGGAAMAPVVAPAVSAVLPALGTAAKVTGGGLAAAGALEYGAQPIADSLAGGGREGVPVSPTRLIDSAREGLGMNTPPMTPDQVQSIAADPQTSELYRMRLAEEMATLTQPMGAEARQSAEAEARLRSAVWAKERAGQAAGQQPGTSPTGTPPQPGATPTGPAQAPPPEAPAAAWDQYINGIVDDPNTPVNEKMTAMQPYLQKITAESGLKPEQLAEFMQQAETQGLNPTQAQQAFGKYVEQLAGGDPTKTADPGFLQQAWDAFQQMDGSTQGLLLLGLGVGAIGLLQSVAGDGGIGGLVMSLLGLGAAGLAGAHGGMLGQDAQQFVEPLTGMFMDSPEGKPPEVVPPQATNLPPYWSQQLADPNSPVSQMVNEQLSGAGPTFGKFMDRVGGSHRVYDGLVQKLINDVGMDPAQAGSVATHILQSRGHAVPQSLTPQQPAATPPANQPPPQQTSMIRPAQLDPYQQLRAGRNPNLPV